MEQHTIASGGITASILAQGAELCRLQDGTGHDYLWPATAPWPRHAPVLFPTIGRMAHDTLRHQGRAYPMPQHGFARDRRFTWTDHGPTHAVLTLHDDAETHTHYPFPFRFEVRYDVAGPTLTVAYTVTNTGPDLLPVSMGAHPAFRWPLDPSRAKTDYAIVFDHDEPASLRSVAGGLLTPTLRPTPVQGRRLALSLDLFAADALIWQSPTSRSLHYAAPGGPALTVAWEGFAQLGIWSKPPETPGDFVCIEPWCGLASPADFDGEILDKPAQLLVPPGETRTATHRITVS